MAHETGHQLAVDRKIQEREPAGAPKTQGIGTVMSVSLLSPQAPIVRLHRPKRRHMVCVVIQ